MVKNKGHTLPELMITVAIIGAVTAAASLVMNKTLKAQMMASALTDIQQGAFASFDVISRLLRQASLASVTIDRYDNNQPPWSRLTFTLASTGKTISIYQRGQKLYFGNNPVFGYLRVISFAHPKTLDGNIMAVSMTFEKSIGLGKTKAIQLYIQRVKIQND